MRTWSNLFSISLWLQDRIRGLFLKKIVINDFKASNGWSDRWKAPNSALFKTVSNELKLSTLDMTAHWNEMRLPTIYQGTDCRVSLTMMSLLIFSKHYQIIWLKWKTKIPGGKYIKVQRILRVISYQYLSFEKPKIWDVSRSWCPHRVCRKHK